MRPPVLGSSFLHLFAVDSLDVLIPRNSKKNLQAVLAEVEVVCVCQPMLIAGDLHADPAVIPCLAEGISAGRYVDLALAYSQGAGLAPDVTCRFNREEGTGSRRDFFCGVF